MPTAMKLVTPVRINSPDMTGLVNALTRDLWRRYAVNGTLDWHGVERHLDRLVDEARRSAQAGRQTSTELATTSPHAR